MKTKKIYILAILLCYFQFINAKTQYPLMQMSMGLLPEKDSVINIIYDLPEIKKFFSEVYASDTTVNASVRLYSEPEKDQPYYIIQVGVRDEIRFSVYFNFWVYVKENYAIKYFDVATDKAMTIEEWRKKFQNRNKFNFDINKIVQQYLYFTNPLTTHSIPVVSIPSSFLNIS